MQKTTLGRTGLSVTRLGFGALEIRGTRVWGGRPVTDDEAERILTDVLDVGINFVDTSPDYGLSEGYIGRFTNQRRPDYILATKCGCILTSVNETDAISHDWSRETILNNIAESLDWMRTDYVDVLQLHNASVEAVERNNVVDTLREIQDLGLAKFIGVSTKMPNLEGFLKMGVFDTFQIPYSAFQREHEEWIRRVSEAGAGTIIRGGVAQGTVLDRFESTSSTWRAAGLDELRGDMSKMEFMLRFTLSHPHIDTAIVGTKDPEHLAENVAAAERGPLPPEVYEEAKNRLDAAGMRPGL